MEKPNISEAVLQTGTEIEIEIANPGLWHKLGLKKTVHKFVIKPIYSGSLLEICRLLEKIDFQEIDKLNVKGENTLANVLKVMSKNIIENTDKLNQILAWGIFNRRVITVKDKLKMKWLVRLINDNLDNAERVRLLNVIIQHMGTQHFLAFMVSIKGMNLIETEQTSGELSADATATSTLIETL